ncbi:MAG: gamma-glutamyltransferase [Candidatus Thorarchaeota archaeon]
MTPVIHWRRPQTGRSAVYSKNGLVSSSHPLASSAGIDVLKVGGSACDAAIAMASVLNVVEPFSTGIGGDAFALIHIPDEPRPRAINGSGFAPKNLSYQQLTEELELPQIPVRGPLPITVPGAVSAWQAIHDNYGRLPWEDILEPAIRYAQEGFPVSPVIAHVWKDQVPVLRSHEGAARTYLTHKQQSPQAGEIWKQPALANTLMKIAKEGSTVFYNGEIAFRIEEFIQQEGGYLQEADLSNYEAEWTDPISLELYDNLLWEHGPNGQGLTTLLILAIVEELEIHQYPVNSAKYLHCLIEAKKLAFSDAFAYIADPKWMDPNWKMLLSRDYAHTRASIIEMDCVQKTTSLPYPLLGEDTVYLTVVDGEGYAISFINSLFDAFGSGLVDPQTGIAFQNRGACFNLIKNHPNQYEPSKRPFHTIIPAMITSLDGELLYSYGVMGGHHQPQGQAQVYLNLVLHKMNPQQAIETPRFHHDQYTDTVAIESPVNVETRLELRNRGHRIVDEVGANFGGGQIIHCDPKSKVYCAGSDPRKDGQAQGF